MKVNKPKKLMLLGGLRYLLPVIEAAHRHGIHVITVDYLPGNIAHKYSDEYHNVSIIDKEAVLALAQELQIDGIMSFAVDPGVVAAAYTAEKMGLPFQCSYEAACILQDKSRFRQFLAAGGFNVPNARGYSEADDALKDINYFNWPVIVKPVDSAGSKGVTRVDDPAALPAAIAHALDCSPSRHYIIEDFLEKVGPSMGNECFVVDGVLKYNAFYDQFFDNEAINPYAPSGEFWPSAMSKEHEQDFKDQLQRLFDLLHITTGMFNVECRVCTDGKCYLMEVSPRAGGNRLAEILNYAADVDIIEAEVLKSVGLPLNDIHEPNYNGFYAINVLHSEHEGIFKELLIDRDFERAHLVERDLWVKPGDTVQGFTGANQSLGTIFLRFDTREELNQFTSTPNKYISIVTH
jgi:biotin carboxylase